MAKALLGLLLLLPVWVLGQKADFHTYPKNYPLRKLGYPSNLVAGNGNTFYYAEHWNRDALHPLTGLYIQCYSSEQASTFGKCELKQKWARPLQDTDNPFDYQGLQGLDKGVLVWGYAPDRQYGGIKTVVRFWGTDGYPKGPVQTVSTYFKAVQGFEDHWITSPDRKKILWLGTNPKALPKDQQYYCSVWSDEGRMQWGHEVKMPYGAEGYVAKQYALDPFGNLYFLLVHSESKNESGEKVTVPRIVKYDYKTRTFSEQFLSFACTKLHDVSMHLTADHHLYVLATLQTTGEKYLPILNYDKTVKARWSEVAVHQLKIYPEWQSVNKAQWSIPDTLLQQFKDGAFFNQNRFLYAKNQLFWCWEETRSQFQTVATEHTYEDVAVFAIATDSLKPQWVRWVLKEQKQSEGTEKCSYLASVTDKHVCFAYPTGEGIASKLALTYIRRESGKTHTTDLKFNNEGKYDVLVNKGCVTEGRHILFMGPGSAKENAFLLTDIYALP